MIKKKKGAIHVEMIISFIVFISFIIFMLIIFKPLRLFSTGSALDITKKEILEYISVNLTETSLILSSSFVPGEICYYVDFYLPKEIVIKDGNFIRTNAMRANEKIYFKYTGKRFYKIYSSKEFKEGVFDISLCEELAEKDYTIGVTRTEKKVSDSMLHAFFQKYNENDKSYASLKDELGLQNDFNIIVRDSSGVLFEGTRYKPKDVEVIAKDIPIEILDEDANLNPAIMNIQVW